MMKTEIVRRSTYVMVVIKPTEMTIVQCCPKKEPGLLPSMLTSIKISEY